MLAEWNSTQERMGSIAGVVVGGYCTSLATMSVSMLFFRLVAENSAFSELDLFAYGAGVFFFLIPPIILIVNSMIETNSRAAVIGLECIPLIIAAPGHIATSGVRKSATARYQGECLSEHAHFTHVDVGMEAMKFSYVIERNPCQLKLLGRAISWGDVAAYLGTIIAAQVFNILGLG